MYAWNAIINSWLIDLKAQINSVWEQNRQIHLIRIHDKRLLESYEHHFKYLDFNTNPSSSSLGDNHDEGNEDNEE